MIRFLKPAKAAGATAQYYTMPDLEDMHTPAQWRGKLAEQLGLKGDVDPVKLTMALSNFDPNTGLKLTMRNKSNRRAGQGIEFDAHKSVTAAALLVEKDYGAESRANPVIAAFANSVLTTLDKMEESAGARVMLGKSKSDRITGNWAASAILNFTARPVKGSTDPQLHARVLVVNATKDTHEGKVKALQMGAVVENRKEFEKFFNEHLAAGLQKFGYAVGIDRKRGVYVRGIPESVNKMYSPRAALIENLTEKLNTYADNLSPKKESIAWH